MTTSQVPAAGAAQIRKVVQEPSLRAAKQYVANLNDEYLKAQAAKRQNEATTTTTTLPGTTQTTSTGTATTAPPGGATIHRSRTGNDGDGDTGRTTTTTAP